MALSEAQDAVVEAGEEQTRRSPLWRRVLASPNGLIGASIVLLLVLSAAFADLIAPYSPIKMGVGQRFLPPVEGYPLGTDEFGRDMFTRILYGSRARLVYEPFMVVEDGTLQSIDGEARALLPVRLTKLS